MSIEPTTNDHYHRTETIWRVILDIASLLVLLIITVISNKLAIPFVRGFSCSDTNIKLPFKPNTIPTYAVVILSLLVPLIWMYITEFSKRSYFKRYPKPPSVTKVELYGRRVVNVHPFTRNLYILTVVFVFGYISTWVLTEIAKNFVGRLRPHFLMVCEPNLNCTDLVLSGQAYNYQNTFTCQNRDEKHVREARRSFFSGHASSMFYGMSWLIMYIHVSWSWRHLGILGNLFQTGFAVLAFYVGYSRISDFQHHWQDVLVGGLVGALIAFVVFKFILNWRHYNPTFLPYTTLVSVDSANDAEASTNQSGTPIKVRSAMTVSQEYLHERNI